MSMSNARARLLDIAHKLDRRLLPALSTLLVILTIGLVIRWLPGEWTLSTGRAHMLSTPTVASPDVSAPLPKGAANMAAAMDKDWRMSSIDAPADPATNPAAHVLQQGEGQLKILFEHGGVLLQSGQYQAALDALRLAEALSPTLPEIQVNLGFALYELGRYKEALLHLDRATALRPMQANAYYAAALAYEGLGELAAAVGAMRSYLHLSAQHGDDERSRLFAVKARAALWEWDARLGRATTKPAEATVQPSIIPPTIRARLHTGTLSGPFYGNKAAPRRAEEGPIRDARPGSAPAAGLPVTH